MTRLRTTLSAAAVPALAISLGAAPPTRPTAAAIPSPRAVHATSIRICQPERPAAVQEAVHVLTPRAIPFMPTVVPPYQTPRAQWIPRRFNGWTFYLVPCDIGSEGRRAAPAVSAPAGR